MTTFTLNGAAVEVPDDRAHLLVALREDLGIISAKDGCAPSGQCGCCTVLLDGKAVVACQVSLEKVAGREVVTLEGIEERQRFADAFAAAGALQCGFCTPGILVRTKALLEKGDLTREKAARHLGAHLCRCTGYLKILDAIEALARGESPVPCLDGGVGARAGKHQGSELSAGSRPFIDDLCPEGLLHAVLRLADHARADVVHIDTTAAAAVPGVEAVLTAADVPGELRVGLIHKDWPVFIPEGGRTSYLGDVLAVVVAADRATAERAAALVDVSYEVLAPIVDPEAALAGDEDAVWGLDGNELSRSTYARGGDVDATLAASAHVVRQTFRTQRVEQAFLEPESTLAAPSPRRRAPGVVRRPGRLGRPRSDRVRARPADRCRRGRVGLQRRGVRGQGGHGQPGPDRVGGPPPAAARQVHADPRAVAVDPPQAPSDRHAL